MPITETTIKLTTGVPGCVPCGCGPGSVACSPCPLPRTDQYFTLLAGFLGAAEPGVDVSGFPPLEFPLVYSEAGPAWSSGCIQVPTGTPDGFGGTDFDDKWYRITAECSVPLGGIAVSIQPYVDEAHCAAGDTSGSDPIILLSVCAADCDPLKVWMGIGSTPVGLLSDEAAALAGLAVPEVAISICVTVRKPACGEDPGDPIPGVPISAARLGLGGGTAALDPCTTDAEGRCCLTADRGGRYRITATLGSCVVETEVVVTDCDETIEVLLVMCCARACLDVTRLDGGAPVEGATVTFYRPDADPEDPESTPVGTATSDADGLACRDLTTAEMLSLPPGGSGCSSRRLVVRVTPPSGPPELIEQCQEIEVSCGADGSGPEPIALVERPAGYVLAPPETPGCCDRGGCFATDLNEIGLQAAAATMTVTHQFFDASGNPLLDDVGGAAGYFERTVNAPVSGDFRGYESGCFVRGGSTNWPRYDNGTSWQYYESASFALNLCGEGGPSLVVDIYRSGSCTPDDVPGTFPGNNDIHLEIPLTPGPGTGLCYGQDPISLGGTEGDPEAAHMDWTLDASAAA